MSTSAQFVVAPPSPRSLPVVGTTALFPLRRVFCVGRNYAAHAREMGADPNREPPFFFCKPTDAVVAVAGRQATDVHYPPKTSNLNHEVELVVAIGKGGANIIAEKALEHVFGYAIGLDLTRRDIQGALKSKGHPWEMGKAFDESAPVSAIAPASRIGHPASGAISLRVNGELRQEGDLADMIWPVADTIAQLSTFVALAPGDLIFTGTPEGVGALLPGDLIDARIAGLDPVAVRIV